MYQNYARSYSIINCVRIMPDGKNYARFYKFCGFLDAAMPPFYFWHNSDIYCIISKTNYSRFQILDRTKLLDLKEILGLKV